MAEQEWKITNSFWTPDTPAASFFAHREVFDPYYYEGTLPCEKFLIMNTIFAQYINAREQSVIQHNVIF